MHLGITTLQINHVELDRTVMELWADNGDRISTQYAGTAALKGDFTRTGKRSLRGALDDASSSLARLVNNTTFDFFRQATIDYTLGTNPNAFVEFASQLQSLDPSETVRLSKMRELAISTAAMIVIGDKERQVGGWVVVGPEQNTLRGRLSDKVALLSNEAFYISTFNYKLMKVRLVAVLPQSSKLIIVLAGGRVCEDSARRHYKDSKG